MAEGAGVLGLDFWGFHEALQGFALVPEVVWGFAHPGDVVPVFAEAVGEEQAVDGLAFWLVEGGSVEGFGDAMEHGAISSRAGRGYAVAYLGSVRRRRGGEGFPRDSHVLGRSPFRRFRGSRLFLAR